jgi:hypothetical protein
MEKEEAKAFLPGFWQNSTNDY